MALLLDRPETVATYTSMEAAELTGLTYRQIDYWSRQGYITPLVEATGTGSRRRFSAAQVDRLQVVGAAVGNLDIMLSHVGVAGAWVVDLLRKIEADPDADRWLLKAGNVEIQVTR